MEAQLLRRFACLSFQLLKPTAASSTPTLAISAQQRRHRSSARRTKRALNIPPHPSFLTAGQDRDRVIFNPPSSEPSIFHTPFKFLPKSDPRRRAQLPTLFDASVASSSTSKSTSSPSLSSPADSALDPATAFPHVLKNAANGVLKPWTLTPADVAEMRRLRAEDPIKNSVVALAERFSCAKIFVMMCCHASREHQDMRRAELQAVRDRWGPRRAAAREARYKRNALLFAGKL